PAVMKAPSTNAPASAVAKAPPPRPEPEPVPHEPVPQQEASPAAAAAEPAQPVQSAPGALDATAVRRVWGEVLAIVNRKNKRTAPFVREATVRDIDGDTLVLVFKHSLHANSLSSSPEILIETLYELLGGRWQIRCEVSGQGGSASAAGTANNPRLSVPPA